MRGGILRDPEKLLTKAQKAAAHGFGHVISVHCDVDCTDDGPGLTVEELCEISDIPHSKIQLTTVNRLAAVGVELELDVSDGQPFTHHNAKLPEPVGESAAKAFIDCFDMPIPKPGGGKEGIP